jgi:hypothetical protein
MNILIRPCYDSALQNRLFEPKDSRADHWQYPMAEWKKLAKVNGIEIDTWDIYNLSKADQVWIHDLPASRNDIIQAKALAPNVPFVLLLYESPLGRSHFYNPKNHDLFDAVITFNHNLCDEQKYFHYNLPIGIPEITPNLKSFNERKLAVMINSNKYAGVLAQRQPGLSGLPLVGPRFGGWQDSLTDIREQQSQDLYERRRKIARLSEKFDPKVLDIYGSGWKGEAISWVHKFLHHRSYRCAKGLTSSKIETLSNYRFCLAFENITGNYGYISEKIFDCFYSGVVPIYLGDYNIQKFVEPNAYVDARKFRTDKDLLIYIQSCSKSDWEEMYIAGQDYLKSEKIKEFQEQIFARRMLEIIQIVQFKSHNEYYN